MSASCHRRFDDGYCASTRDQPLRFIGRSPVNCASLSTWPAPSAPRTLPSTQRNALIGLRRRSARSYAPVAGIPPTASRHPLVCELGREVADSGWRSAHPKCSHRRGHALHPPRCRRCGANFNALCADKHPARNTRSPKITSFELHEPLSKLFIVYFYFNFNFRRCGRVRASISRSDSCCVLAHCYMACALADYALPRERR